MSGRMVEKKLNCGCVVVEDPIGSGLVRMMVVEPCEACAEGADMQANSHGDQT